MFRGKLVRHHRLFVTPNVIPNCVKKTPKSKCLYHEPRSCLLMSNSLYFHSCWQTVFERKFELSMSCQNVSQALTINDGLACLNILQFRLATIFPLNTVVGKCPLIIFVHKKPQNWTRRHPTEFLRLRFCTFYTQHNPQSFGHG